MSRIAIETRSTPAASSRSAYPLVMVGGMVAFGVLDRVGLSALVSAYVAVAVGAVAITMLETRHPYRPSWRTTPTDAIHDITFMVIIQILLPTVLSLGVVTLAADATDRWGWDLEALWPRSWPVAAQATLMLVVGDAMRYWLHRLSHRSRLLWRFHAVHHSPAPTQLAQRQPVPSPGQGCSVRSGRAAVRRGGSRFPMCWPCTSCSTH